MPTQRFPSWSNSRVPISRPSHQSAGVTNAFRPAIFEGLEPLARTVRCQNPPKEFHRDQVPGCGLRFHQPWASIGYVSEMPACQCTRAVSPPSQKPPFPSATKELTAEVGMPSALPKHLGHAAQMAKGRVGVTSQHPQRSVCIFADRLKHLSVQVELRSNNTIFQAKNARRASD